MEVKTYLLF